jgi:Zn-dependent peptidase ImmA (M78 family)
VTQSLLNGQGAVAYPSGTRAHRTRDASGWAGTSPFDYIDARFARKLTGDHRGSDDARTTERFRRFWALTLRYHLTMRVSVKPELLRWARERARIPESALARRLPKLAAWEQGTVLPTLKQVEAFARATHAPIGYLFLETPPVEDVPIPDFRTFAAAQVAQPSADLLDTIYTCQQRQEWYRESLRTEGEHTPLPFVGSATLTTAVVDAAERIRSTLGFSLDQRRALPTWTDALRQFITQADNAGVLVMVNGVVGNNNRRKLDPAEFRGFALSDPLAPLVFINGADTKAAQMFTLAHELAHIWLGVSALSNVDPTSTPTHRVEEWCNQVAAETLVPLAALRQQYRAAAGPQEESHRLARVFKVSPLVVLRRLHDAGALPRHEMWEAYAEEVTRLLALPRGSGGDFYLTQAARVSKRFARALVASTLEGRTLYRDAFRLLGFSKLKTFRELGRSVGAA